MGGFSVRIEGLQELDAKLTELGTKAATRIIRKGLNAGGEVIQAAVQERAPVRPDLPSGDALPVGALAQDIQLRFGRDDEGLPAAIVGPGKYTSHAANWVEYGHRLVKGGYSSVKRGKLQGHGHQIGTVPAHPFIRPGYEASAPEAVEVAVKTMTEEVEKEAQKK